jgi:hypothetical protein
MSYSFLEPELPAYCECRYDEARDEMDREDCPFHCNGAEVSEEKRVALARRKGPARVGDVENHTNSAGDHCLRNG